MGNALCNILTTAGFDVQKEFYINDAGLQVKLLGQSVHARYQQLLGNEIDFPEDGYQGDYIEMIAKEINNQSGDAYVNRPFDECADFFINYSYKYNQF